jgi:elongation factor Ts
MTPVATISASVVKELRDKTGAGMMDCKRALAENDGDMEKALDWLRKKGQAIATKKAAREASEGLVACRIDAPARKALILQLNCETDFVARNEKFIELLDGLSGQVLNGSADSVEALLDEPSYADPALNVRDLLKEKIAGLGENIEVGRFVRLQAQDDLTHFHSYIHPPGKLGVLLAVRAGKPPRFRRRSSRRFAATSPCTSPRHRPSSSIATRCLPRRSSGRAISIVSRPATRASPRTSSTRSSPGRSASGIRRSACSSRPS